MSEKPMMVLTGGSGVLGRALINHFKNDYRIVCLTNRSPVADSSVEQFQCHFWEESLGLSDAVHRRLADEASVVLHAAASTNWRHDASVIFETNTRGAEALSRFAIESDARMVFFSTAFVMEPPDDGVFPGAGSYVRSKIAAEKIVKESGCRGDIVRPSIIIGDSTTGAMPSFQGFHTVLGGLLRGRVPAIPCPPGSPVDVVSLDSVCMAVRAILDTPPGPDVRDHWLTSGSAAPSAREVIDLVDEHASECGLDAVQTRFIDADSLDRLIIPLLEGQVPEVVRDRLRELLQFLWLFQSERRFPSDLAALGLESHVTNQFVADSIRANVAFLASAKGLCRHSQEIA